MKTLATALLLIAALPVQAQINKCKGPDGKTVYQDTPCATAGGQEMNIKNQPTDPWRQLESERQARRDISAARELDREREARQRQADLDRRMKDIDRQAKADRCARYESRARNADTMANVYRTAPYRDGARAESKAMQDRHFSECFASR